MKHLLYILICLNSHVIFAQFGFEDSIITDLVSFKTYLTEMQNIDAQFSKRESITYSIPQDEKWAFICSYKTGWQEIIGPSTIDSGGINFYRQEFNNIRVSRSKNVYYQLDDLKKMFHFDDSQFIKDTSGIIISGPIVMLKNEQYLLIAMWSYYPNGNQTSWDYRQNYYFKKQQE